MNIFFIINLFRDINVANIFYKPSPARILLVKLIWDERSIWIETSRQITNSSPTNRLREHNHKGPFDSSWTRFGS